MNPVNTSKQILWLLVLAISALGATAKADSKLPAGTTQNRSVFVLPTSSREGRDPFFPESTRSIEEVKAASRTVEITALKVPGISGTPGHLLAIINNHTFAIGDEGDVLTSSGRVHLRCIEIQRGFVLVEINGQSHRLNLDAQ